MEENKKAKIKNRECSTAFKWFHATSNYGGPQLIYATVVSYLSVFLTDTVGIAAGAASLILLLGSVWDIINDPLMGAIADRTNTKMGRYRPYYTIFPVLFAFVSIMLFLNPQGLTSTQKVVYIAVFYILFGMTTTILTMPHMAILPACTKNNEERNSIISLGGAITAIAYLIASSFTTNFLEWTNGSYVPLMVIYGILGIIAFWGLFATAKEKYLKPIDKSQSFAKELKMFFSHKEIYPVMVTWFLVAIGYGLMFSSSVYYIMYYAGRPDLITSYMLVLSGGALLSMAVLLPIALRIFKTGHRALMVTQLATGVLYVLAFILGKESLILLYVISFLATSMSAMSNALVNVLVNDTIDFIQMKDGNTLNGIISSIKGFANKCGGTFVNSGILAILAATGYVAGAVGQQPESVMIGLNMIRFGIPAIVAFLLALLLKFYPLKKYYPQLQEMRENMKANDEA
ncbi:MAG: MFS transporter [Lachnospiraceae bacterium]|nr:MFS transporter [Lachnospiraceae bacterium]